MKARLLIGAIALSLSLGACEAAPGRDEKPPATATVETAPPTAAPEATTAPPRPIEIQTGQTPEALGKNLFEVAIPNWIMTGTDDQTINKVRAYITENGNSQLAGFYTKLAKENSAIHGNAILSDTLRPEVRTDFEEINAWVMDMNRRTSRDEVRYKVWHTVESSTLVSTSGTTRTILITFTSHDNSEDGVNKAKELISEAGRINGDKSQAQVTFDSASGTEKITSYTVVPVK